MPPDEPAREQTVDYRRGSSDADPWPVTVAFVTGVGRPAPDDDLRALLRRRLLFFALLMAAAFVVSVAALVVAGVPLDAWTASALGVFALGAVLALVLWLRPGLSVRQLRGIELALFGAYYVQWAAVHGFLYPTITLPRPPMWFGTVMGFAVSLPWAFLIVVYGILVPNTWRRCAAVVGVVAVTPLVIHTANGVAAQVSVGQPVVIFYAVVGVCLSAAAAIAVYGSHRIDVLQKQVAAARRLGQYQLGRWLGVGGMGEVYFAEHVLLRRPCAVKLIRPDLVGAASLDRFEREVRSTATLTHPNTVQVYDYGRADDGTFYYAMEYLPGVTLDELVARRGPLPPGRAVHLLRQVCGALGEAHAVGLVHRDVKPSNIMVCARGGRPDVVKLLDFGLAVGRDPATGAVRADGVAGTPDYMAPEQAAGHAALGPPSDLYGLGAVAYILLTGRPPFPRGSLKQVLAAHRAEPVEFPPLAPDALPDDVKAVVLRCLAKNPAERFPDADALERAWAGCGCAGTVTREEAIRWWRDEVGGRSDEPDVPPEPTRPGTVRLRGLASDTAPRDTGRGGGV